ncbi:MAG: glycosyltransferase family 4 protein [Hymenobacteraceae bacterium]|nr:glycosyltransferase family 4 protein [Hymenobacteraceae bacterium]
MIRIAVNVRFLLPGDSLEGIGRYTFETLRRLVAAHPAVAFDFLFDRPFDPRYVFGPNVTPHVLGPPARHPVLWWAWFEGSVARWLRRHRPAVFLSFDGYTTLRTSVPRLTVLHDLAFEHFPAGIPALVRRYYQHYTPRFARASAGVIAVSEATKADLVRAYDLDPARITVAPNAPAAYFRPLPAAAHAAVRAQYAGGQPYFLFVGALHPRKNLPNLLRAFDAFKAATGSATQLVLVGRWAWQTGAIAETYRALRYQEAVHLTGRLTDVELARLYGAARALCYVPFFEGFGLPVVEAQASGCPVITSDCSSLPEAAGAGGALFVPPADVPALTVALTRLDTDPALRAQLTARGFENVRRFSWDETAARIWEAVAAISS